MIVCENKVSNTLMKIIHVPSWYGNFNRVKTFKYLLWYEWIILLVLRVKCSRYLGDIIELIKCSMVMFRYLSGTNILKPDDINGIKIHHESKIQIPIEMNLFVVICKIEITNVCMIIIWLLSWRIHVFKSIKERHLTSIIDEGNHEIILDFLNSLFTQERVILNMVSFEIISPFQGNKLSKDTKQNPDFVSYQNEHWVLGQGIFKIPSILWYLSIDVLKWSSWKV